MLITRYILSLVLVGLIVLSAGVVLGQNYPGKPIRMATIAAGSGVDTAARLIAQGISVPLGQPVIVDNRAGYLSEEIVSKASPDGYNLLVAPNAFFYGPLLQDVTFDPVKDFTPITLVVSAPSILVVSPALPVNSVAELIALAKTKPGALNYASGSTGGGGHLTAELFKAMAGVNIVRVPYKTTSLAYGDVMAGQVQIIFENPTVMTPLIKAGKMKGLAVTSLRPSALIPGLPPVAAALPGFEFLTVVAVFAPAKTPAAIVTRLNQEIVRVLNQPAIKERFINDGVEIVGSSPQELGAWMKTAMTNMGKVIKDAGIRVQ